MYASIAGFVVVVVVVAGGVCYYVSIFVINATRERESVSLTVQNAWMQTTSVQPRPWCVAKVYGAYLSQQVGKPSSCSVTSFPTSFRQAGRTYRTSVPVKAGVWH